MEKISTSRHLDVIKVSFDRTSKILRVRQLVRGDQVYLHDRVLATEKVFQINSQFYRSKMRLKSAFCRPCTSAASEWEFHYVNRILCLKDYKFIRCQGYQKYQGQLLVAFLFLSRLRSLLVTGNKTHEFLPQICQMLREEDFNAPETLCVF